MQSTDRCLKSSSQLFLAARYVHEGNFRRFQPPDFKFSNWGETTAATALSGHVWIPNPQKLWKMVNDCRCLNCRVKFCDVVIEKKLYAPLLEVVDAPLHDMMSALKALCSSWSVSHVWAPVDTIDTFKTWLWLPFSSDLRENLWYTFLSAPCTEFHIDP